jgi:flagellar biosynthesis protein FlhB
MKKGNIVQEQPVVSALILMAALIILWVIYKIFATAIRGILGIG